jgi:hypothetical protein
MVSKGNRVREPTLLSALCRFIGYSDASAGKQKAPLVLRIHRTNGALSASDSIVSMRHPYEKAQFLLDSNYFSSAIAA